MSVPMNNSKAIDLAPMTEIDSTALKVIKDELAAVTPAKSLMQATNRRILVVEDEVEIGNRIREILSPSLCESQSQTNLRSSRHQPKPSAKGASTKNDKNKYEFEVDLATSAEQALKLIKTSKETSKPYALGFFDVLLGPGMDGFELFKEAQILLPEMQGVFVTAYNDRSIESIDQLFGSERAASWDYLNKPFSRGEILQKARNFVSLWNLKNINNKQAEILAANQQKLMEGERHATMATMARGLSHEFGNLLMQIVGQADLNINKDEDCLRKAMHRILDASDRASQVLGRFKDLSRGPQVDKEWTSLNRVMEESLGLLEHQFRKKNITVIADFKPTDEALLDATGLLQVVVNLTINAVFVSKPKGKIYYSLEQHENNFVLKIRDAGPGVDVDILPQIFNSFFTTKDKEGTGLGLAICQEIIEVHHEGTISASNHEDGGLEIVIEIPVVAESDQGGKHGDD